MWSRDSRRRSLWRDRRGATAVEFAFVGSIFIMLMFGVVEYGRYYISVQSVRLITGEAARRAITQLNATIVGGAACNAGAVSGSNGTTLVNSLLTLTPLLNPANWNSTSITATCPTSAGAVGTVTVVLSYRFNFIVRFLPSGNLTISDRTTLSF
jgi:Flp pilus assembly protein TadG